MFIYLFVVYFSFAPVISAITHRYCELFYIQVLMMVIITETLTSTSHHDIFTYLDYIFSCYLHTVGFYPCLLSYIYIYIYIYIMAVNFSLINSLVKLVQFLLIVLLGWFCILDTNLSNLVLVFTSGLEDWDSIPCQVIPKTQKMVLDASLLNTQHYKVGIKDKVE